MVDEKALLSKIRESGYKLKYIADYLGLSYYGLRLKISGRNDFKAAEISKLAHILKLSQDDIISIFFALRV